MSAFVFAAFTISGVVAAPSATANDAQAVTVRASDYDKDAANAPFPDLELTVSQTSGLVAQGIQISWTGGKQSVRGTQQVGGENFLQFAQCWGDDPANPGTPDRTTCQYGAFKTAGAARDGERALGTVADQDEPHSSPHVSGNEPANTAIPFKSVTKDAQGNHQMIERIVDGKINWGVDVNTNEFFNALTTNEIPWAGSGADGTGSVKFEVQTAAEARGLGCGRRVAGPNGDSGASCWLVAIPRGTADVGEQAITKSGLFWDSWKHHIAVKLDFRPVGLSCAIGAAERQVVGSELAATAVGSWQPALCGAQGGDVYNMIKGAEADALARANSATGSAPLALTSEPYRGPLDDNLVYAPVALSAVSIGFAIDRFPKQDGSASEEALGRSGLPMSSLKLNPRLIAKLLSNSYRDSLPFLADRSHLGHHTGQDDPDTAADERTFVPNPRNLLADPEFLAINDPEWREQGIAGIAVSDMLLPQGRSDVASALWRYVMADAAARAFLEGTSDEHGMVVNPYASTNPALNPTGAAVALPRDNFPKSDPTQVNAQPGGPAEINLVTWRPYISDLDRAAYYTLRGDGQTLGDWDVNGNPPRYPRNPRELPGSQAVLALTDASAAAKYQVVTAALENPARQFVTVSPESMTAAASAMTQTAAQPQVQEFDATSERAAAAATAYPLTMPVYAAANPETGDDEERASYARFVRYAAGAGQLPGVDVGQLPAGYAPLPEGWRAQAVEAASVMENGWPPAPAAVDAAAGPTTTAPASTAASTRAAGVTAPAVAAAGGDPAATGAAAGALSAAATPADPDFSGAQAALPISALAGLAAAAMVLFIPRLPRRAESAP